MSLLAKVQKLKSEALKEIANKANEVRSLNKDLESFISQAKKEIASETDLIEKKKRELIKEEQRINNLRKKTTTELDKQNLWQVLQTIISFAN